jgi:hypothetical protein
MRTDRISRQKGTKRTLIEYATKILVFSVSRPKGFSMDNAKTKGWDSQAYFCVRQRITARRLTKFAAKRTRPLKVNWLNGTNIFGPLSQLLFFTIHAHYAK